MIIAAGNFGRFNFVVVHGARLFDDGVLACKLDTDADGIDDS